MEIGHDYEPQSPAVVEEIEVGDEEGISNMQNAWSFHTDPVAHSLQRGLLR